MKQLLLILASLTLTIQVFAQSPGKPLSGGSDDGCCVANVSTDSSSVSLCGVINSSPSSSDRKWKCDGASTTCHWLPSAHPACKKETKPEEDPSEDGSCCVASEGGDPIAKVLCSKINTMKPATERMRNCSMEPRCRMIPYGAPECTGTKPPTACAAGAIEFVDIDGVGRKCCGVADFKKYPEVDPANCREGGYGVGTDKDTGEYVCCMVLAGASAGGATGGSAGGTTGSSAGGTTGSSAGGTTGSSTGGTTGSSTGGTTGSSTGGTTKTSTTTTTISRPVGGVGSRPIVLPPVAPVKAAPIKR